jgi:ABC-type xylose transport system permease subunit
MLSKIKWVPLFIGIGIAILIEVAYNFLFPAIESARLAHSDKMQNVEFAFFLALLIAVVALWFNWYKGKHKGLKLPLVIVIAALIHVNYLTASIDCCPGG